MNIGIEIEHEHHEHSHHEHSHHEHSHHGHHPHEHHPHEHHHEVHVVVDGERHKVKSGRYLVSEFKKLMGVDSNKELDVVEKCEFRPLCDTDHIVIHECMVFVSHVKIGCSS